MEDVPATVDDQAIIKSEKVAPQNSEEDVAFSLLCRVDNAKIVANILSALHLKKDGQVATVTVTKTGVKFTVEDSKSFQGNAFLQEDLFQEFKFNGEHEQFKVNFSILIDCLGIYGASSLVSLQIAYAGYGNPLLLILNDNGVITNCALKTLESDELFNFNFRNYAISSRILMQAEVLKDAFNELDWSASSVTIICSPDAPFFRLATDSTSGSCQVDYPKDSEIFELFETESTQSNVYKLSLLQPVVKALGISHKTQLRVNKVGVLSLQHMIKNEDKGISFVDFFIAPEDVIIADIHNH